MDIYIQYNKYLRSMKLALHMVHWDVSPCHIVNKDLKLSIHVLAFMSLGNKF